MLDSFPPTRRGARRAAGTVLALSAAFWSPGLLAQESGSLAPVEVADKAPDDDYITADERPQAGKLDVPVEEQPFGIEVIDRSTIEDTGAQNIQHALMYTSGVYSGNFGFDTRGDSAKIRGLNPSLYVDGLRANYGSYNTVRPNTFGLERIEVLKGPSSVLYGQAELGGIINGVSKLPKAKQQGELHAQVGNYDRQQLAADVTGALSDDGKLLYRLVALKRDTGTQVDHVDDDGYLFAPSITWLPTDDTTISVLFNSQEDTGKVSAQFLPSQGTIEPGPKGEIGSETFVGEPDWDRYDRRKDEVTLFVDHRFTDQWGVAATARYTESGSETREHWTTVGAVPDADGNMPRTIYMSDKETEIFNFDVRLKGDISLGPTRHKLALGVDRQNALWEEENVFSGAGTPINVYNPQYGDVAYGVLDPQDANDNKIKQTGVYLIDHVEIGRVVVSGALRRDDSTNKVYVVGGDNTESDDEETSGRLGLMYRFDFGLSPYISYSEAFVPNLGTTANGESLDATTGEQREAGFKYLSPRKDLSITAAWFDIEETNRVLPSPTSPVSLSQTGATVEGWEMAVRKSWERAAVQATYTKLDAKDDTSGVRLPYVAEEVANVWGKYELENGFRIGAGVRYIGDTVGGGGGPEIPSETLYDAMLGYATGPWDFNVTVKNLTDEEFISWCRGPGFDCGYGERRLVIGNASYRF
ncbi:TonB-dependent siderophore receptor [Alloalcanivorax profundimaris]|uniref:TonB-dependent siderophore receptor n=1 Tax=Alloalcanivorax profundimaris TaxID=2735259 RepID=UPI000C6BEBAF|nr:TonB-dependent siderophore receptor [Alloalcanivorax profundimaris]MBF1801145.1 TonB-dependent siderophore receptor [Alloalcanivorax profundimaris]MBI54968.1 TonB-dependent siderophore receptor [Alcanivorax sp.]MBU60544.1 TonB-dependent siderophore receptor [Alcanivorax sp.]UWN50525.1 Ferrichrome-iron receptor [Alcanivorax sp. ALC70]|tara:strand:- start:97280 stop:99376 length:2097 start_codon:yes stop_codon:yes gene_type:complete